MEMCGYGYRLRKSVRIGEKLDSFLALLYMGILGCCTPIALNGRITIILSSRPASQLWLLQSSCPSRRARYPPRTRQIHSQAPPSHVLAPQA